MSAARDARLSPSQIDLCTATEKLLDVNGGPTGAERHCRANFRFLSDYQRDNVAVFAPADVIVDLERRAKNYPGAPFLLGEIAKQCGYIALPFPPPDPTHGDLHAALAAKVKEGGDVVSGVLEALSGPAIDAAKARHLQTECVEAARAAMQIHALLGEIAESGE